MDTRRYALAPMSGSIAVVTLVLLALPVAMVWGARLLPPPMSPVLYGAAGFNVLLFAFIFLWSRPVGFELSDQGLEIQWPLRRHTLALRDLTSVELVDFGAVRAEFGRGMRVGAGGLGGAFGSYVTSTARLRMYISRFDELALLRLSSGDPWLISPAHGGAFVQAVRHAARLAQPS